MLLLFTATLFACTFVLAATTIHVMVIEYGAKARAALFLPPVHTAHARHRADMNVHHVRTAAVIPVRVRACS